MTTLPPCDGEPTWVVIVQPSARSGDGERLLVAVSFLSVCVT
jgi:hypothetical protein